MPESKAKSIEKRRAFTIELNSKTDVERVMVPNGVGGFLVEGTIGALKHADFVEDSVLELTGTRGTLRVDLSMDDLARNARREGPHD